MEWTGEKIKELRKRLEVSQGDFASMLGMTRAASVSNLENGKAKPKPQTVKSLDDLHAKWSQSTQNTTSELHASDSEKTQVNFGFSVSHPMKRYRIVKTSFDTRPWLLNTDFSHIEDQSLRQSWQKAKQQVTEQLVHEYGFRGFKQKIINFKELESAPFSVVGYHNAFHSQARKSFVIGSYYPALTATCALGERILNHLLLGLRDSFKSSQHYKKIYNKQSIDDWNKAIDILSDWGIWQAGVEEKFRLLRELRNEAIHFRPETDNSARDMSLRSLNTLSQIIENQFGIQSLPWIITDLGSGGYSFIKKEMENDPFVQLVYIPSSVYVGPCHSLISETEVMDLKRYEETYISDKEFVRTFKEFSMPAS